MSRFDGEGFGRIVDSVVHSFDQEDGKSAIPIIDRIAGFPRIFMGSIRTPSDAATARTPESEVDDSPKIHIPIGVGVQDLIREARAYEARADAGGLNISEQQREAARRRATDIRIKALTLHMGIETL